tara:strand:+ start:46909 stop:48156 length:1248 start_codon:yes stop_codon:yes gene_type:complete
MLKLIKRFFTKEQEVVKEQVNEINLGPWLNQQISFASFINDHFSKISSFKDQLTSKVTLLSNQEVSETDKKQVEARVQNIVIGHRDNYVREIELFLRELNLPEDKFDSIEACVRASKFNQQLDDSLVVLSKRTAKAYQATQHLFFDRVEEVFKLLTEINKLVKGFELSGLSEVLRIQDLIIFLEADRQRKFNHEKISDKIKHQQAVLKDEKLLVKEKIDKLLQSEEYQKQLELRQSVTQVEEEGQAVDRNIFSFFSKLTKPLKKFERIAEDRVLINKYLKDSVLSFKEDKDLMILEVLSKLKKNLNSLNFDKKQEGNFLQLILKAEKGYLRELANNCATVDAKSQVLQDQLKGDSSEDRFKELKSREVVLSNKIEEMQAEIDSSMENFSKIDLSVHKEEIKSLVRTKFNKELKIV